MENKSILIKDTTKEEREAIVKNLLLSVSLPERRFIW